MGKNENLRDIDRIFIYTTMLQMGIVPMEDTKFDIRRALKDMSPEDARTFKRKFRKLWRKAIKDKANKSGTKSKVAVAQGLNVRLGTGKHVPSRSERNARKQIVFDQLWEESIQPMINQALIVHDKKSPDH